MNDLKLQGNSAKSQLDLRQSQESDNGSEMVTTNEPFYPKEHPNNSSITTDKTIQQSKNVPIWIGIGYGQAMSTWFVVTYYCCLMALTTFYFFASFSPTLPWTVCDESWADGNCYSAADTFSGLNATLISYNVTSAFSNVTDVVLNDADIINTNLTGKVSSAEQYL